MPTPPIVVYGYPTSPFFQKLELVLLFHQLPYDVVQVPVQPPRDALLALGVTYRRIPVLAIGNDLYFDTSLAASVLATHPLAVPLKSSASPTLDALLSFYWADRAIFRIASTLIPWSKMPPKFIKDREEFGGAPIVPSVMEAMQPSFMSSLNVHLAMIESLLQASSTSLLVGTSSTPSLLDISIYFVLSWTLSFPSPPPLAPYPGVITFLATMKSLAVAASTTAPPSGKLSAEEAVEKITSWPSAQTDLDHDSRDPLGYAVGTIVTISPDDVGRVPQTGSLKALNSKEIVLQVQGPKGRCQVHAPRLGFVVRKVDRKERL